MVSPHSQLKKVTERVIERSKSTRSAYLARIDAAHGKFPARQALSCANLAHGFAGLEGQEKIVIKAVREPNIGIVSSYNEMLSAHAPYNSFPDIIKAAAREHGGIAQFAGGVPAMCDGITQGNAGMELSLFSREVIAMSTAVALTHNAFDAVLCLGVCDKIVPGLAIGALQFGHLPTIFVPAGPMTSGLTNDDKAQGPSGIRDRQVRSRGAPRSRSRRRVSRPRYVHLLRHGQQQSDAADGSDGPASAERGVRASAYAVARCAHRRGRAPRARYHARARQLHADRPCGR